MGKYLKSKCNICGLIHYSAPCPVCKKFDVKIIGDTNPLRIFVKKPILEKVINNKITGFLFHKNKKALKYANKKIYAEFFNKRNSIRKDIVYFIPIRIQTRLISLNDWICADNIKLAKIAFSLGLDISNKGERKFLIDYVRENLSLPFQGWYLRIK